MEPGRRRNLRKDVAAKSLGLSRLMPAPAAVTEDSVVSAKQIIKEGLSEYFIYTVEGTESIPNGWSKRLRSFDAGKVPVKLQYRYRPREYGEQLVRMYLMKNDEKSGLGSTPLPNGKMSIFRTSSGGGLNYLASLPIKYVPVGDQLEVNLGNDPDVAFKLKVLAMHRDDIWLKLRRANAFKRVGDGATVLDNRARVIGWNENRVYARVIKNFSARPIEVHIRRSVGGDATLRSQLQPKRHDFNTFELTTTVATGATRELIYQVVTKQGRNSKQARLAFESATVTRPRF